jgi:hypothetical protein
MRNGDFLKLNPSKKDDLIEDIIPYKKIVLSAGLPGDGKTFLNLGVAYHIACGADFLNKKVNAGSVLIIDSENPEDDIKSRIRRIKKALKDDGYSMKGEVEIQHYSEFLLDNKATWTEIVKIMNDIKPALITLDHLNCFHNRNENSSREMEGIARRILELVNICGSTVHILHHFNKNSGSFIKRLRGSTVIYARSEAAYEIRALSHKGGGLESFGIIPQPRKEKIIKPIRIILEEDKEHLRLKHGGDYEPIDDPELDMLSHMIAHSFLRDKEMRTVNEVKNIMAGMGSDKEIRDALRMLDKKGVVDITTRGKNHEFVYRLKVNTCPWCKRVFP